ncbi:MAG: CRISPR-associated endonuclease Cas2 [Planctomycetota bacterium]
MKFLVAYDICCPRRLRRVARCLEKHALRCQKSVFMFQGPKGKLNRILDDVAQLIDANVDLVQAWKLAAKETPRGTQRGTAPVLFPAAVVLGQQGTRLISEEDR